MKRLFNKIFNRRKVVKGTMVSAQGDLRGVNSILNTFTPEQLDVHRMELERVYNATRPTAPIVIDEIVGTDYRAKSVADWLIAMRAADMRQDYSNQSRDYGLQSNWVLLFDIFANMVFDPQVAGSILTLSDGVFSKEFSIVDKRGKRLDDLTAAMHSQWFFNCLEVFFNTHLYGFSLLQIDSVDAATTTAKVREVNRRHVRPDLGGVVAAVYDQTAIAKWNDPKYKRSTIYNYQKNLGALNNVVRWYIYKSEVSRYWAIYNQLYGTPIVVGQTDIHDTTRRANLDAALQNFVKTRWLSLGLEDSITTLTPAGSTTATFEAQIRLCDEQISKGLLASTMVMDNGASKAQGDVHAENTSKVVKSISRYIMFRVNDELLPKLRALGMRIPRGARFRWEESEKLTMVEKSQVLSNLSIHYAIPASVASEFIGIDLEDKEREAELNPAAQKAMENYKKTMRDGKI